MLQASLTIRQWYEQQFLALYHQDASPRTIVEYGSTINAWELLTENLSLGEITTLTLAKFRATYDKLVASSTVNKHLRHLNHLLGKAGPAGPRNRDALGIISESPWIKQLRTDKKLPRAATLEGISIMYRSVPDDWWRGLLVVLYNTGSRISAVLELRQEDVSIVDRQLRFDSRFDKRRTERLKPLSKVALRHLLKLRRPSGKIFEYGHPRRQLYREWHALQDLACLTDDQKFLPHDLKRACGTQYSKVASPWAVRYMLDHAQRDVTGNHYIDPLDELRAAVEEVAQPKAFREGVSDGVTGVRERGERGIEKPTDGWGCCVTRIQPHANGL